MAYNTYCKIFVAFYIVNLYICDFFHPTVFMTHLWVHGMYAYMYICSKYVCRYVCIYVCMYVCLYVCG